MFMLYKKVVSCMAHPNLPDEGIGSSDSLTGPELESTPIRASEAEPRSVARAQRMVFNLISS